MAESQKSSDKLSMTSSDLGSSCDNDVDLSSDAKGRQDDAVSVDGSASLTLDSLEEEEEEDQKELQCSSRETSSAIVRSDMLSPTDSRNSFYLHKENENCKIESCRDKYKLSDLAVHSEQSNTKAEKCSRLKTEKELESCSDASLNLKNEVKPKTPENNGDSHAKRFPAKNQANAQTVSTEQCPHVPETTNNSDEVSSAAETEMEDTKLFLRKSKSLTDESSSDPSPKHSRRSGIPRRKSSTQSLTAVVSSAKSSSHTSPGRVRSFTVNNGVSKTSTSPECSPCRNSPASFPQTPVKTPKLRRSASQSEFPASCSSSSVSRDTLTSRLRFEKHHQDHERARVDVADMYLTPSQRKDLSLKELRAQIKELNKQVDQKEKEIEDTKRAMDEDKEQIRKDLQEELEKAREAAEAAGKEVTSLRESHTESVKTVATLQQQLEDVKKEMMDKLAESEEIFLEMYKKGRESAIFEHEEELELQQKGGRSAEATDKELHNKLVRTQAELAKWQTIQRHESYHTMPVPGTEAETTLRFLKDAVFHFLTADKKSVDEHLRAIVRILRFSEVQREKIAHAIIMKRNKSGW